MDGKIYAFIVLLDIAKLFSRVAAEFKQSLAVFHHTIITKL